MISNDTRNLPQSLLSLIEKFVKSTIKFRTPQVKSQSSRAIPREQDNKEER